MVSPCFYSGGSPFSIQTTEPPLPSVTFLLYICKAENESIPSRIVCHSICMVSALAELPVLLIENAPYPSGRLPDKVTTVSGNGENGRGCGGILINIPDLITAGAWCEWRGGGLLLFCLLRCCICESKQVLPVCMDVVRGCTGQECLAGGVCRVASDGIPNPAKICSICLAPVAQQRLK